MNGGCTGHCCDPVNIRISPEELRNDYDLYEKGEQHENQDIHLLYPMLKYVEENLSGSHKYECKHFDTKTRLCTIYNIRPGMCRKYPKNDICEIKECQWGK